MIVSKEVLLPIFFSMRKSIAKKLTVYFLFLSLASTAIVGFYAFVKAREALIKRTFEQLVSLRTEKNNRLSNFFEERLNEVQSIAKFRHDENLFVNGNPNTYFLKFLQIFLYNREAYHPTLFFYSNQKIVAFDLSVDGKIAVKQLTRKEKDILQDFLKSKVSFEVPFVDEIVPEIGSDFSTILVGTPYKNTISGLDEIVLLSINLNAINDIMFEDNPHNGLGESGETYLVGPDYLMRSNSRFQKDALFKTKVETIGAQNAFANETGMKRITDYRNIPVYSAYSKLNVKGLNWAILAEIDIQEAMIPITNIRNNIIYLSLLIALFLIGVVAVLANLIALPIKNLKRETEKVAKGIYGKTILNDRQDEIGDLIIAFNQMTTQLKEQAERLDLERLLRLSSMIDGQEMERQRLSRELHDSLGQLMLTIKMKLERAINSDPIKAREILIETQALFSSTVQEIRNISNNLLPAVLNEFGIVTALKNLASEVTKNTDLTVEFNTSQAHEKYNSKVDIYLYRIVQEALNNAVKHARASKIGVNLIETENNIELIVVDNGIGYSDKAKMGNGISNMRERANLIGGTFSIVKNTNGQGTQIQVIVPK